MCSTRWKPLPRTRAETTTTATVTDTARPAPVSISAPIATPASSAQRVPTLATISDPTASSAAGRPWCSRTSSTRPLPVTTPVRAASSWKTIRATVDSTSTHSNSYP